MDSETVFIIFLFFLLPILLLAVIIWLMRTKRFIKIVPDAIYQLTLFKRTVVVSKYTLIQLCVISLLFVWMNFLLPIIIAVVTSAAALIALRITRFKRLDAKVLSESSESLLQKLSNMQVEIGSIKEHIESLGFHIISRQIELDEKESKKQQLDQELIKKYDEAELWTSLTEQEKCVVTSAAVAAMPKQTRGQFWLGIILGFFINLMATLTWTLLGNPGKADILVKFRSLVALFR